MSFSCSLSNHSRSVTHSVERENGNDFVPWRVGIWFPSGYLGQTLGDVIAAFKSLGSRVGFAREAASEGVAALGDWVSAIGFVSHELANRDGIGRVLVMLVSAISEERWQGMRYLWGASAPTTEG